MPKPIDMPCCAAMHHCWCGIQCKATVDSYLQNQIAINLNGSPFREMKRFHLMNCENCVFVWALFGLLLLTYAIVYHLYFKRAILDLIASSTTSNSQLYAYISCKRFISITKYPNKVTIQICILIVRCTRVCLTVSSVANTRTLLLSFVCVFSRQLLILFHTMQCIQMPILIINEQDQRITNSYIELILLVLYI